MKSRILNWLYTHANEKHTPQEWAALLDCVIYDVDGWRFPLREHNFAPRNFNDNIGLLEFVQRISVSTIG